MYFLNNVFVIDDLENKENKRKTEIPRLFLLSLTGKISITSISFKCLLFFYVFFFLLRGGVLSESIYCIFSYLYNML